MGAGDRRHPFERVLGESLTEIALKPEGESTEVTIAWRQKMRGYSRTGGFLLSGRAGASSARRSTASSARSSMALSSLTRKVEGALEQIVPGWGAWTASRG